MIKKFCTLKFCSQPHHPYQLIYSYYCILGISVIPLVTELHKVMLKSRVKKLWLLGWTSSTLWIDISSVSSRIEITKKNTYKETR